MRVAPTKENRRAARQWADKIRDEPDYFLNDVLGSKPWVRQRDIIRAVRDNVVTAVKSCHGAGKSWVAARVVLWFLLAFQPAIVITTAPTDRQVRGILWREIRLAYQAARVILGGRMLGQELRFADNWWAWGFTAPSYDPNRFQGWHEENVLVVVDESVGVADAIFDAIDGILTSANSRLLMISNPTDPAGYFARTFRTPGAAKLSISAYDTPNFTAFGITEKDIADPTGEAIACKIGNRPLPYPKLITPHFVHRKYHHDWRPGSPFYRSRILAEFPLEGPDTLIPLAWIEAAQNRETVPKGRGILGVDVGGGGASESVIFHRRGGHMRAVDAFHPERSTETVGRVRDKYLELNPEAIYIDEPGVGYGVIGSLQELGVPVVGVNVGRPSSEERFGDLRAEAFWLLRSLFEDGTADLDPLDDMLASQLASLKYGHKAGKVRVESKSDMRDRGLPSPDRADAAMLSLAGGLTMIDFATQAWVGPQARAVQEWGTPSESDEPRDL